MAQDKLEMQFFVLLSFYRQDFSRLRSLFLAKSYLYFVPFSAWSCGIIRPSAVNTVLSVVPSYMLQSKA
jgi:hypothetical protein